MDNQVNVTLLEGPIFNFEFSANSNFLILASSGATGISNQLFKISIPDSNYIITESDKIKYPVGPGLLNLQKSNDGNIFSSSGFYNKGLLYVQNSDNNLESSILKIDINFENPFFAFSGALIDKVDNFKNKEIEWYLLSEDSLCSGSEISAQVSSNGDNIVWSYNDNIIGSDKELIFQPSASGKLGLTVYSERCNFQFERPITVIDTSDISITLTDDNCGYYVENNAYPELLTKWLINDDTFIAKGRLPISLKQGLNDIELLSIDGIPCDFKKRLSSYVETEQSIEEITLPNVIAPNGSIINSTSCIPDIFQSVIKNFELQIFDRWGNLIFKSSDPTECWDGTLNGTKVNNGVYVYIVKFSNKACPIKNHLLTGDITLF